MRVVTWNVRSLRDGSAAVAVQLRALHPDLVLLQEAPRLMLWRTSRRRLARASGLRLVTHARAGGNALLAAPGVEVRRPYAVVFPKRPRLHRRATVGAVVLLAGRELAVAGSHLDLDAAARQDSARRVRVAAPDRPLVVGADVNEEPGGAAWALLSAGLVDALGDAGESPTFPAGQPMRRLDGLFVDPALRVVGSAVVPTAASDHRPVVVDLEWAT